jgi:hypothetical protein
MMELSLQVGKKNFDTLNNRDKKIINDMVDNKDNYQADVLGRPDKDPNHIKKLSTRDIMGKYVKNAQAGQLFIVTGKLHNGYDSPIEHIRIRGELFVIGERLSQTEIVYAGIKINEHELSTTPVAEIKKRLRTIPQDKKETAKVLANQDLGFMIVFSDLPKGIDQFGVQPVFSAKVQ